MTTDLKPCPFCGASAHFEIDGNRWEWVECENCGMQGNRSASLGEDCKPILAAAWNHRAYPEEILQALKLCRFDSLNLTLEDWRFVQSVISEAEGRT